jgi:hypothetical protein
LLSCGGAAEHHTPVMCQGHWAGRCDYPPTTEGDKQIVHPKIATYLTGDIFVTDLGAAAIAAGEFQEELPV